MKEQEPVRGGIVAVLQFIALVSIGVAFVGGALAGLSLGAEIILMASVTVTAALIWAASVAIQELRNITFNTQRIDVAAGEPAQLPANRDVQPSSAHNVGGLR